MALVPSLGGWVSPLLHSSAVLEEGKVLDVQSSAVSQRAGSSLRAEILGEGKVSVGGSLNSSIQVGQGIQAEFSVA